MVEDSEKLIKLFDETISKMRNTIIKFQPMKEISMGEYTLLKTIKDKGDNEKGFRITSSRLSNNLEASRPATSRMLNLVEEKGLIKRTSDKEDRRIVYIELTESGIDLLNEESKKFKELIKKINEKMGKEDMEKFIYTSKKLCNILMETMEEWKFFKGLSFSNFYDNPFYV